jgi:hypothetical protein
VCVYHIPVLFFVLWDLLPEPPFAASAGTAPCGAAAVWRSRCSRSAHPRTRS